VNDFYLFKGGKMELKETGRIHSPYKTVKEAPRQGKLSDKFCEIEIFPAYEAALLHVEDGKYYVVLYFAHKADRTALQTVPPWAKEPYGVFAAPAESHQSMRGQTGKAGKEQAFCNRAGCY